MSTSTAARERDQDYMDRLYVASTRLARGAALMTVFLKAFDDDGHPKASTQDAAVAVGTLAEIIKETIDDLMGSHGDMQVHILGQRVLDQVFPVHGAMAIAGATLRAGTYGNGDGVTCCPVENVVELALDRTEAARRTLDRFLSRLPKPRKAA